VGEVLRGVSGVLGECFWLFLSLFVGGRWVFFLVVWLSGCFVVESLVSEVSSLEKQTLFGILLIYKDFKLARAIDLGYGIYKLEAPLQHLSTRVYTC
jgi:hypothetical protein